MSNLIEFTFEGNDVRVVDVNGEPHFVGKDVALALGYSDTSQAIRNHCKGSVEMTAPSGGGNQKMRVIPERDVYRLIMRSKLESAERFEEWVVGEVLPSIRKHGGYIAGQDDMSGDELLAKAVLHAQSVIAEKNKLLEEKSMRISEMEPKEHFYETVTQTTSTYRMDQVAKNINVKGMGRNKLYAYLRSKGIFQPNSTTPYQRYVNQGYFKIVTTYRNGMAFPSTVAFQKGIDYIIKLLRADGYI